ncbi:CPBP family intramembrane glutamic endopeptidase [Halorussus halophilus]|uniref:CPBP family intramembrane glutamic endopeptidase n=1 Tax=Halorussus halophilus TaxID=2650975 RepID=UPI00130188AD|nr:CPBP family intramembrane glutamic endopeptidase [Halorussus halophilus]
MNQATDTTSTVARPTGNASFGKRFVALFALGMVGVIAVGISTATGEGGVPGLPEVSTPVLAVLVMVQPALLLALAVAVGTLLAPRVGLTSHVDERVRGGPSVLGSLREELLLAIGVGGLTFVAVVGGDVLFAPFVAESLEAATPVAQTQTISGLLASLPVRLFYGGITEELLLRWGVLTLFAWAIHAVLARFGNAGETLAPATAWVAIVLAALLFGVGHLPALASMVELTPALIVRTVALNAVAGIGFGWLYWRKSLEAAMVAHATFHVVLVSVSVLGLLVA